MYLLECFPHSSCGFKLVYVSFSTTYQQSWLERILCMPLFHPYFRKIVSLDIKIWKKLVDSFFPPELWICHCHVPQPLLLLMKSQPVTPSLTCDKSFFSCCFQEFLPLGLSKGLHCGCVFILLRSLQGIFYIKSRKFSAIISSNLLFLHLGLLLHVYFQDIQHWLDSLFSEVSVQRTYCSLTHFFLKFLYCLEWIISVMLIFHIHYFIVVPSQIYFSAPSDGRFISAILFNSRISIWFFSSFYLMRFHICSLLVYV